MIFLIPLQVQAWGGISLGLAVLVLDFLIWSWTCASGLGLAVLVLHFRRGHANLPQRNTAGRRIQRTAHPKILLDFHDEILDVP